MSKTYKDKPWNKKRKVKKGSKKDRKNYQVYQYSVKEEDK